MKKKFLIAFAFVALLFSSCAAPNVSYFNDMGHGQTENAIPQMDILLRPDDKISIVVKSKDPALSELFNLPIVTRRIGFAQSSTASSTQQMSVYTVDSNGEIDFPVLGKMKVQGMRRDKLAEKIKNELITNNLVKDPVVIVEFGNQSFSILGEVNRPGRYSFDRDHFTILDAISMAGDLTILGKRENIFVMRSNGDTRITYRLNLQNGNELLQSPAYYLQQNDVIYVEPNKMRSRQTKVNGNNVLSAPFWISVASLLTSIAVFIKK